MARKDHKSLGERFEEFAVQLEAVRGSVTALENTVRGEVQTLKKVLGMSRAEQHQFNEYVIKIIDAHENKIGRIEKEMDCTHMDEHVKAHEEKFKEQDRRINRVESRQSYLAGAWAVLFAAFEGIKYFFWGH